MFFVPMLVINLQNNAGKEFLVYLAAVMLCSFGCVTHLYG